MLPLIESKDSQVHCCLYRMWVTEIRLGTPVPNHGIEGLIWFWVPPKTHFAKKFLSQSLAHATLIAGVRSGGIRGG